MNTNNLPIKTNTGYYPMIVKNHGADFLMEEFESTTECAYSFLHGECAIFAYALAKEFGYKINILYANDFFSNLPYFCHSYCTFEKGGVTYYVDIRGITANFEEMINEFEIKTSDINFNESYSCKAKNFKNSKLMKGASKNFFSYWFENAKKFINANKNYYCI